ncbi:hypothetical protein [Robbsia sp. KACC 23696]|uniref:hypothetical protein n=1 Tax=Robbsia sp. KACC 23696 TaxID=3149231 RepID=UPI00325A6F4A
MAAVTKALAGNFCESVKMLKKGLRDSWGRSIIRLPAANNAAQAAKRRGVVARKVLVFKGAFLLPGSSGGFVLGCVSEGEVVEQLFADWDVSWVDLEISQTSLQKSA